MEKFRGSADVPLTDEGLMKAHKLGINLAERGGIDRIMASDLNRTLTTAKVLNHYTRAPIVHVGTELHPWHLGALEGQEVTPERVDFMNDLIRNHPDYQIPGRGELSTGDGESFNQFKNRVLPLYDNVLRQHIANPGERTMLVSHFRNKKLMEAWIRTGAKPSGEVDKEEMTQDGGSPGSLMRVSYDPRIGYQINDVDEESNQRLLGGVYICRHEKTPWNRPDSIPTGASTS
jgi:broad specificity phosphatase PhoE